MTFLRNNFVKFAVALWLSFVTTTWGAEPCKSQQGGDPALSSFCETGRSISIIAATKYEQLTDNELESRMWTSLGFTDCKGEKDTKSGLYCKTARVSPDSDNYKYWKSRYGIEPYQAFAILEYTRPRGSFLKVNAALRSGQEMDKMAPVIEAMIRALRKVPIYKGLVLRGVNLPDEALKQHQVGAVVTYDAFTSTGKKSGYKSKHRFRITSKTGRDLDVSHFNVWEQEVIFLPKTRFRVLERKESDDGNVEFLMEEVD